MDNPCNGCAANGICPYFETVNSYSERCDDVLARFVEGSRNRYRKAWDSYLRGNEDVDLNNILSSLL